MTTSAPVAPIRIELSEQLIVANRQLLKQRVVDHIADGHATIVLDASRCGYVDSSGLGVLVSLNRKCRDAGGALVITGLTDEMRDFLEYTQLDTVLSLEPRHDAP